ncbi:MAG: hypothetical protein WC323_04295, partial [Patescibacteria group bacterium]
MAIKHPFKGELTKHHMYPKARIKALRCKRRLCGNRRMRIKPTLVAMFWDERHSNWHKLFRTATLEEVIFSLRMIIQFQREFPEEFRSMEVKFEDLMERCMLDARSSVAVRLRRRMRNGMARRVLMIRLQNRM